MDEHDYLKKNRWQYSEVLVTAEGEGNFGEHVPQGFFRRFLVAPSVQNSQPTDHHNITLYRIEAAHLMQIR